MLAARLIAQGTTNRKLMRATSVMARKTMISRRKRRRHLCGLAGLPAGAAGLSFVGGEELSSASGFCGAGTFSGVGASSNPSLMWHLRRTCGRGVQCFVEGGVALARRRKRFVSRRRFARCRQPFIGANARSGRNIFKEGKILRDQMLGEVGAR